MDFLDSMLLLEFAAEEVKYFGETDGLVIQLVFGDFFKVNLQEPAPLNFGDSHNTKRKKEKDKLKSTKNLRISLERPPLVKETILLNRDLSVLLSIMVNYPMELSLWNKLTHEKITSLRIPWNNAFVDYLHKSLNNNKGYLTPVALSKKYTVFDDTANRLATISLYTKMKRIHGSSLADVTQYLVEPQYSQELSNIGAIKTKCNQQRRSKSVTYNITRQKISTNKKYLADESVKNEENSSIDDRNKRKNNLSPYKSRSAYSFNEYTRHFGLVNTPSFSSLKCKQHIRNTLNYIFGDQGPYGNQVYCVGYCTVENNKTDNTAPNSTSPSRPASQDGKDTCSCDEGQDVKQYYHDYRDRPDSPNDSILIDIRKMNRECCNVTEKVEEVVGGVTAQLKVGDDPCYCTCECKFGFIKRTTYCGVCGGYEIQGDDMPPPMDMPFPCPIFHKLVDKNKSKPTNVFGSDTKKSSGSDTKKNVVSETKKNSGSDSKKKDDLSQKSFKAGSRQSRSPDRMSAESEKDAKKRKRKLLNDDRFKFNYGYKAPQIGHFYCATPCSGTLGSVPKKMGWLWTAEDVPGLKYRPGWQPGAANKHVVRLLRMAKNPEEVSKKKRKRQSSEKKKPLKRPLLTVHKKDGEYTVTMETMKTFNQTRRINQFPYEEKPLITYTIGRTEEENRDRRIRREIEQKRLDREKRQFIQQTFKDMCQDICLKTYQQALGLLPSTEDPQCPCFVPEENAENKNPEDDLCICSDDFVLSESDTDDDEWFIEFTPPVAYFDPTHKVKKIVKVQNSSQYTYLDYKVKLLDRFGNPVPRFFRGPDGKQQCSDLGGFWGPDKKWLEINVDGYIAPDGRWAPNAFFLPDGEKIDAESGKFQINTNWYVVGVDGYIDEQNVWRAYSKSRNPPDMKQQQKGTEARKQSNKKQAAPSGGTKLASEATWSCFGDADPVQVSKLGITGHGQGRKLLLTALKDMIARGEQVSIPHPTPIPHMAKKKGKHVAKVSASTLSFKCHHSVPSDKGVLALNKSGEKIYFKKKEYKNRRPKKRLEQLKEKGVSVSSFHVPCLHSFMGQDMERRRLRERLERTYGIRHDD